MNILTYTLSKFPETYTTFECFQMLHDVNFPYLKVKRIKELRAKNKKNKN